MHLYLNVRLVDSDEIFARNKAHHNNPPSSAILLVHSMAQNKAISDDSILSILDFVDEHFLEVESSE
jgi:hypothetical protein